MNTYSDKKRAANSDVVQSNLPVQSKIMKQPVQLRDNRPQSIIQKKLVDGMANAKSGMNPIQKKENNTGLPDNLKSGIENLSGHSMDDVKVHYNSAQPAQLNAHAYAQGTDIHIAPGQEKHLPHEAWHVVQQKQGRVKPTMQMKGKVNINDDNGLENEADVMGEKVMQMKSTTNVIGLFSGTPFSETLNDEKDATCSNQPIIQRLVISEKLARYSKELLIGEKNDDNSFDEWLGNVKDRIVLDRVKMKIIQTLERIKGETESPNLQMEAVALKSAMQKIEDLAQIKDRFGAKARENYDDLINSKIEVQEKSISTGEPKEKDLKNALKSAVRAVDEKALNFVEDAIEDIPMDAGVIRTLIHKAALAIIGRGIKIIGLKGEKLPADIQEGSKGWLDIAHNRLYVAVNNRTLESTIVHELTHLTLVDTFANDSKPYSHGENDRGIELDNAIEEWKDAKNKLGGEVATTLSEKVGEDKAIHITIQMIDIIGHLKFYPGADGAQKDQEVGSHFAELLYALRKYPKMDEAAAWKILQIVVPKTATFFAKAAGKIGESLKEELILNESIGK